MANVTKKSSQPNTEMENKPNLTLKGYFSALPKRKSPRKDFIDEIVRRCGVSEQTVRNWCIYGMKPLDFRHVKVLSELTGIREEDLWRD